MKLPLRHGIDADDDDAEREQAPRAARLADDPQRPGRIAVRRTRPRGDDDDAPRAGGAARPARGGRHGGSPRRSG